MALHVFLGQSSHAGDPIQYLLDSICQTLKDTRVVVRYVCSDGDSGYNKRHYKLLKESYSARFTRSLSGALDIIDRADKIRVSDFLHLWKNFCKKVKNYPVAICPEMSDDVLTCQDPESLLNLGNALSDKSSIGRMGDPYALRLFSLANCLDCVEKDGDLALLYLLPWALQEEMIRGSALRRRELLEKAVLSCYLLIHFFDLSFFLGLKE
jgi:hypothetical protein